MRPPRTQSTGASTGEGDNHLQAELPGTEADVGPLAAGLPPLETMHPKIAAIVRYWQSIHPLNRLPGRQHFDPRDIPELWRNIMMIEVARDKSRFRFRFRFLGTTIIDYAGEDNTGKWFDERWPDYDDTPLRRVVEQREPSWWRGPPQLRPEKQYFELERVRLPLARDGETVDMLLGLTVFFDSRGNEIFARV